MDVMDVRRIFSEQEQSGFPDLAGSDGQGRIRVSERLLNEIITEQLRGSSAVRELHVVPRADNRFGVRVVTTKAFLPAISIEVAIDKQPSLPGDPVLGLTLSGLGGMMRFAGGFLTSLPPGVRMDGERVFVDLRAALAAQGLASVLNYVKEVRLTTEEGRLIVSFSVLAGA